MMKKYYYQLGYGGTGMFLAAVAIGLVMYFYFYPTKFSETIPKAGTSTFCRPYVEDNGNIKPDAPEVMAPAYEWDDGDPKPTIENRLVPYRLIKASVPVVDYTLKNYFSKQQLREGDSIDEIQCGDISYGGATHNHFCQWVHPPLKTTPNLGGAYQYGVAFPANYSSNFPITGIGNAYGTSADMDMTGIDLSKGETLSETYSATEGAWTSKNGMIKRLAYGPFHIIFLVHLDQDGNWDNPENDPLREQYPLVDVYQQVQETQRNVPVKALPESLINCVDLAGYSNPPDEEGKSPMKLGPVMESSPDKAQEQLGWFLFEMPPLNGWYQPSCKPAINLYPQKDTLVNVQVSIPNGFLTYTDPLYPRSGWTVLAKPSGQLSYLGSNFADSKGTVNYPTGIFPYLYYEGKIADTAVTKPDKGFVVAYENLASFFDDLLPKLGLNAKESQEFKDYWLKALPKASYYFIGIIPQEQLNTNEPLTITPKEDTMIRVRLYFEQREKFTQTTPPTLETPTRNGFTVVDWGGMVKRDKDHPFTCLQ